MMIRVLLLIGLFLPLPAFAQSNEACDAACPVPCYFGSCSPAKATYERALAQCNIEQLDAVAKLYRGTRSATQAEEVLARLRSQTVGRIGVTPNNGPGGGFNVCADPTPPDACSRVTVPAGFRCTVQNGLPVLLQETAPTPVIAPAPAQPVPSLSQLSGTFGISSSNWLSGSPGASGSVFREGAGLPEMVVIPLGSYLQGSPVGEEGRFGVEGPQRRVTISRPFAMGRTEVTFDQWQACVSGGGCPSNVNPDDEGWGRGNRPVMNVSWADAQEYIAWLNTRVSGAPYRLSSESEWEYSARGGSQSAYPWGTQASHDFANYGTDECCSGFASGRDRWENTSPVGSFAANRFGLHDIIGNVSEWTEDCWHQNYSGSPTSGLAWLSSNGGDCRQRVLRGGSWSNDPRFLRSAVRYRYGSDGRNDTVGFRVARTLPP